MRIVRIEASDRTHVGILYLYSINYSMLYLDITEGRAVFSDPL
jgi:hypothetical protein